MFTFNIWTECGNENVHLFESKCDLNLSKLATTIMFVCEVRNLDEPDHAFWVWLSQALASKFYNPHDHSPVTLDILVVPVGPKLDRVTELSTGVQAEFNIRPLLGYLGLHNVLLSQKNYTLVFP